ncbi:MFS general substrate transporter [Coniochaeta sp. PMI_546]|nr:MFS general substrate transporter [Coniochaeta sp. PMI_546]
MSTDRFELGRIRRFSLSPRQTTDAADPNTTAAHETTTVPDGGYGWIAVFGCAIITWWFVGTTYSWGVIQAALVEEGVSEASTLSFVGSLTVACIAFLAVANARIVSNMGAQKLGFLGVTLLGIGEILAGFAVNNVGALFATVGVVMGVGTSMCFMTVSVIPAQYFLRKRGLANGVVFAAGGLGGAAISLVMQRLLDRVGPAWALRIIGLLTLATGLPAAWLIRKRMPAKRTTFVEWRLFTSLRFDLLFLSGVIATFPLFVPPFFLPLYCQSIALKPSVGAAMVAVFNFSGAMGRVGFGLLCDFIGPLNILFATLLLTGISWAGGYLMGGPIAGYMLGRYGAVEGGVAAFKPAMYYAGSMSLGAAVLVALMRFRIDSTILRKL